MTSCHRCRQQSATLPPPAANHLRICIRLAKRRHIVHQRMHWCLCISRSSAPVVRPTQRVLLHHRGDRPGPLPLLPLQPPPPPAVLLPVPTASQMQNDASRQAPSCTPFAHGVDKLIQHAALYRSTRYRMCRMSRGPQRMLTWSKAPRMSPEEGIEAPPSEAPASPLCCGAYLSVARR